MTDEHIERTDGPTPNGGAYFLAHYFDCDRNPVGRMQAHYVEIHEFAANDELIQKHCAFLGNPDECE